jgi:transcriptional regulator with XRE-family HTH domain
VSGHSPTMRRRRLAAELRRLREAAGLTQEEVAGRLEWDPSKLSRIENRQVGIIARDLRKLLDMYEVTDEAQREGYFAMGREGKQRAWWQSYGDVMPGEYGTLIGLESEAITISTYEQELVPGLLQTEDYARAVIRAFRPDDTAQEISRRVELRLARQQMLARDDPPRLWAVISEAVLRRVVGGRAVMATQLRELASQRDRPVVTVQVLPFTAGEHPAMTGSFVSLDFPAPATGAVYVENAASALLLERITDIQLYAETFRFVLAAALGPKESRDMLMAAADDLDPGS